MRVSTWASGTGRQTEATNALEMELDAIDKLGAMVMVVTVRALRGEPRDEALAEIRAADIAEVALPPGN